MSIVLAQVQAAGNSSISRFPPSTVMEQRFWDHVSQLNYAEAGLLIGAGLVYLLYGWKIFKILVMVNAALAGAWIAYWLAQRYEIGWWLSPIGGLVLAILAWPLMRYAVCLMSGLAGALLGAFVARSLMLSNTLVLASAALGLVTLGLLAFIIFRVIVVGFTSVQGSLMTVGGLVGMVAKVQNMSDAIQKGLFDRHYMLPIMVFIPALIGFVYQNHGLIGKKDKPKE